MRRRLYLLLWARAAGFGTYPKHDHDDALLKITGRVGTGAQWTGGADACEEKTCRDCIGPDDSPTKEGHDCLEAVEFSDYDPHPCTVEIGDGCTGILKKDQCDLCMKYYCKCFGEDGGWSPDPASRIIVGEHNKNCRTWKMRSSDEFMENTGQQGCPNFDATIPPAAVTTTTDFCSMKLNTMTAVDDCDAISEPGSCAQHYVLDQYYGGSKQYPCAWELRQSKCRRRGIYYTCAPFCMQSRADMYDLALESHIMVKRAQAYPELDGHINPSVPQHCVDDPYLDQDPEGEGITLTCAMHFMYGFEPFAQLSDVDKALHYVTPCFSRWVPGQSAITDEKIGYYLCTAGAVPPFQVCANMPPTIDDSIDEGYCLSLTEGPTQKIDLTPRGEWCNAGTRPNDPTECANHFRTGTNGHVYRCYYDEAGGACRLSKESIMCCDHLCDGLATRTGINVENMGGGPYCNAPWPEGDTRPPRKSNKNACLDAYWTGDDGKTYPCVYQTYEWPETAADGTSSKCRLSLADGCACNVNVE